MLKFTGLDGKSYQIDNKTGSSPMRTEDSCKSKLQYKCGKVLRESFPHLPILEELSIPGHRLSFDFFFPTLKIAIEIDGVQHEKYVPFFHRNKAEFVNAQNRDSNKEELCKLNGWTLYRIKSEEELWNIL